jgi:predicted TIM-barrel fold metal-dependent hydrolase
VHPGDDVPADDARVAFDEHGLRVVKLHCSVGGFSVDDERLSVFWRLVERRQVPVVVHVGRDVSGETTAPELELVGRVARRFPGAPIVVAHAGHPATDVAMSLVAANENVYVDLTPRVVDRVDLTADVIEAHHERVLFGSDLPNTQVLLEDNLRWLDALSPVARNAVASGNATRLLAAES